MRSNLRSLGINALMAASAMAVTLNQQSSTSVEQTKTNAGTKQVGDSFYSKPVEGYPVENSLALTGAFIYGHSGSGKSVKMGELEIDVLWLYILAVLVIIGVVVGVVICCCSGGDDEKKDDMMMEEEKKEEEEKMEDMMEKMEEMMME